MGEKNTKSENHSKRLFFFGKHKEEEQTENEYILNEAESEIAPLKAPQEKESEMQALQNVTEETVPENAAQAGDTLEIPAVGKDDNALDIEKDAKAYYTSHHSESIEDKIKNLRENAANGFAKESEDAMTDGVAVETALEDTNDPSKDDTKEAPVVGEAKSYDMSQLISLLKGNDVAADNKKENVEPERLPDEDDEYEIGIHNSELYDDVNEYYHDFEFTDKSQAPALFRSFRKSAVVASIAMILTLITTGICIWFELFHAAGLPFAHMMHPGRYGRIYAMVCLELLALCTFFNFDGLARGLRKFSFKRPAPEAAAVLSTVLCAVHTILTAVVAYESTSYKTFCFAGCFVLLILSVNTFIKAYTRFKAFSVALSKRPKLTTESLDHLAKEYSVFAKYLSDDTEALAVSETDEVADFVKNTYTVPAASSSCNVLMYVMLALSVATCLINAFFMQRGAYEAVTGGVFVFLFAYPVSMLAATAFPYFVTSIRAAKLHSVILGEAAADVYENAGVLSFDDTEVFSPKAVKVTSIKTYNDHRIDKVIVSMARIFHKLGGPLSYVFASSLQEEPDLDEPVRVVESSAEGLHLKVGEEDVLFGTSTYMRLYDIETPADPIDETEMRSLTSILFLVSNGELAAKFYIRYTPSRQFETVLRGLYDAGICAGVLTCDPGIDDQLIEGSLKSANYPIRVIHKNIRPQDEPKAKLCGTVLSISSIHNFLRTFIMLDKLSSVYRSTVTLSVIGSVIGLIASVFLVLANGAMPLGTLIAFQAFWLVPQILVSVFSK